MAELVNTAFTPRIWQVGTLCRAVAELFDAGLNPVAVRGEVSGFSHASSGHCYFSLKDAQGQIRCVLFRRAAVLLDFEPRDGAVVEVRGRLAVYEPRGDLQLIAESLVRAGQGAIFEEFLLLKARLAAEGLFDAGRKRVIGPMPRGIGLVTSKAAAALADVVTTLRRRVPHIPVVLAPAAVQGPQAAGELAAAMRALYQLAMAGQIDVILLVRGGGAMEDLQAFNDEHLARVIVASPVPVISGVGHETDFTIADFCADVRAPTPTAAAELAAQSLATWTNSLALAEARLQRAVSRRADMASQRLDVAIGRLGRPSGRLAAQHLRLGRSAHRLQHAMPARMQTNFSRLDTLEIRKAAAVRQSLLAYAAPLARARLRLDLLDPRLVLRRGYALLTDTRGIAVTSVHNMRPGQALRARLADGEVDLTVSPAARV